MNKFEVGDRVYIRGADMVSDGPGTITRVGGYSYGVTADSDMARDYSWILLENVLYNLCDGENVPKKCLDDVQYDEWDAIGKPTTHKELRSGYDDFVDVPNPPSTGMKYDGGKVRPGLMIDNMANALQKILEVLEFGAKKYAANSWQTVENAEQRYREALYRHVLEGMDGVDEESGLTHLAHIATNALFLLELMHKNKGE